MLIKRNIQICMGSSCFSRGNSEIISEIQKFIRKHNLGDKVNFNGDHCFSECSEGPNIRIGENIFQKINKVNITELLKNELRDLL
jgi:NADH:ubiquinone oxidoreductase subunit E